MTGKITLFTLIVGAVLVILGSGTTPSAAQDGELCIRPEVPFAWIRVAPSSYAGVLQTTYPTDCPLRSLTWPEHKTAWGGVQTWVQVYMFDPRQVGWVEQKSVYPFGSTIQPTPTSPSQPPPPPLTKSEFFIRENVPFVWLRSVPSSYGPVLETVTGHTCINGVVGIVETFYNPPGPSDLYWDGFQWWVYVDIPPEANRTHSWVEYKSLAPCP